MIIQSRQIWIRDQFVKAQIEMNDGHIIHLFNYGEKRPDQDYGDAYILPGFIDIHTHGAYGYDTLQGNITGLKHWQKQLLKEGVTGFLPTLAAASVDNMRSSLDTVRKAVNDQNGARILGVHLEGPYLNPDYAGAQDKEYIRRPDMTEFQELYKDYGDLIRIVTAAPEMDTEHTLIRFCRDRGIIVSAGHSAANYEEIHKAVKDGVSSITHTFNRQSPFHHREIGVSGAALRMHDLPSEIIADGLHVSPDALNIFYHAKNISAPIMVSDSLSCKGLPAGEYHFGDQIITLKENGAAYLKDTDTLAGSTLKFNEGLRRLIRDCEVDPVKAIRSCTVNPAQLLKEDDHLGSIEISHDADLVILDQQFEVIHTWCKGILSE